MHIKEKPWSKDKKPCTSTNMLIIQVMQVGVWSGMFGYELCIFAINTITNLVGVIKTSIIA
jgi:hypothetical protein